MGLYEIIKLPLDAGPDPEPEPPESEKPPNAIVRTFDGEIRRVRIEGADELAELAESVRDPFDGPLPTDVVRDPVERPMPLGSLWVPRTLDEALELLGNELRTVARGHRIDLVMRRLEYSSAYEIRVWIQGQLQFEVVHRIDAQVLTQRGAAGACVAGDGGCDLQ